MIQTIEEKIRQRRRQMLVHSYIYYDLNKNIVSDYVWAKWAKELEQLQHDYPTESQSVEYYEEFKDWDGSSGAFLKFGEDIKTVAHILLEESENKSVKPVSLISHSEKKSQKGKLNSTRKLF